MLGKPIILYLIILGWAVTVAFGLLRKEDEIKGAFDIQYLSFGIWNANNNSNNNNFIYTG